MEAPSKDTKYGYSPTQQRVIDDPQLLQDKPILAEFGRALKVATPRPQTALYAQISDVLTRQLSSILTGERTPENGMNVAAANTNQILMSAGEKP